MDEVDSGGAWLQYQSQSELWSVSSSSQEPVNATPFPCSRALPQQSTTVSTWQSSSTSHQHRTDSSESWHTQTTGYYAQCTSDLPTDGYDDVDCAGPTTFASHIGTCAMTDSSSKDEASGTIFINPPQLALLLKAGLEKYLLIDSRSFLEYNTSHIQQSANVCCSKLVKRRLQRDKVHIRDLLTQTCHLDIDEFVDVIVYDQCTERPELLPDDTFLCVLLSKLATTFSRVALLKGGFLAFQAMYPSLCESKTNSYRCAALTSLSQPCLPVSNVGPTRILPFLYLGSQQDALSPDIVQVNEITYILNVSTTCIKPPHIPDGHFLRIPVNDNYSAKLQPYFAEAFQFLDKVREANGCCLVHCLAGISRSPTLAIAYIMKHLHMSSDDAYRYVKDKRPTISPNFNFLGQLLEFEKQMKRELNNNGEGSESRHWSNYVMDLSSHSPSSPVQKTVRPFAFDTSIQPEQSTSKLSMQNVTVERTGIDSCVRDKQSEGLGRSQLCVKRKPEFAFPMTLTGGPSKLLHHGPSVTEPETSVSVHSSPFPSSKESTVRPNVLNLGFDSARRSPPSLSMGLETNLGMSKSLTDIKETSESESPSPSMSSSLHEPLFTTSRVRSKSEYRVKELASPFPCGETTLPGERNLKPMLSPFPCGQHSLPIGDSVSSLMSPFPCGESTVSGTSSELSSPLPCRETTSGFMIEKTKSLTYNEKMTHKPKGCMDQFRMFSGINESGNISKPELLGHVSSVTSDVISGSVGAPHDLSESKSVKPASPSTSADSSFSLSEPLLNVRGKRPLRSSLSLTLSPITPTKTLPVCSSSGEISSLSSSEKYAPSACKIERRIVYGIPQPFTSPNIPEASVHESKSSASSYSCSSSVTVSASHAVKLKSFTFPTASITLPAQSPTSSLARLHFGSTDTSDSDNDNAMDTSGSESTLLNQEQVSGCTNSASSNTCNKELKFYSFPSTSLDKLNFTPCLSNSTDNLVQSPPPRTTGVKRPLNSDVLDLKENSHSSPGSNNSSMASSSNNSSVSSPTTSSGGAQKPTVRKREGRSKRTLVRPSSIAFSTYPTFDLGSDCQDSPHSSGSATSQDDSSESYVQNGKKSKQSEYLSDVRFRLGRYSEREMYRQITAAMETAMLKSQAFEASRKSRSLDDILSSEDDASTPNCESSMFDCVLRHCALSRDRHTSSSPMLLEKLACKGGRGSSSELYHSNSSLSSAGSHSSLHGSIELIQVS